MTGSRRITGLDLRQRSRNLKSGSDESIPPPGDRLYVTRPVRRIPQRNSDFVDRTRQAALEFNEGIVRPKLRNQFFARNKFAGRIEERIEQLERLPLKPDPYAGL